MRLYQLTVRREFVCEIDAPCAGSSNEVYLAIRGLFEGLDREQFCAIFVNGKNKIVGFEVVSIGSLNSSIVHPREAFKLAILNSAAGVVFAHNHPSGVPSPSEEDRRITDRLRKAGELLAIPVLDHVIIGDGTYYSFADNGW